MVVLKRDLRLTPLIFLLLKLVDHATVLFLELALKFEPHLIKVCLILLC